MVWSEVQSTQKDLITLSLQLSIENYIFFLKQIYFRATSGRGIG